MKYTWPINLVAADVSPLYLNSVNLAAALRRLKELSP